MKRIPEDDPQKEIQSRQLKQLGERIKRVLPSKQRIALPTQSHGV